MKVRKILIASLVFCATLTTIIGCGCSNKEVSNNNEITNTQEATDAGKKEDGDMPGESVADNTEKETTLNNKEETASVTKFEGASGDITKGTTDATQQTTTQSAVKEDSTTSKPTVGETKTPETQANTNKETTTAKPQESTTASATTEYNLIAELYKQAGITYGYADYTSDTAAIANGTTPSSTAYKQMEAKNNEVLDELESKGWVSAQEQDIINVIIKKTTEMNNFISSHLGWSEYEGKAGWGAALAKNDYTVKYFYDQSFGLPHNYTTLHTEEQMLAEVRYAIYNQVQYNEGRTYPFYYDIIDEWLKLAHPQINSISAIVLSECSGVTFEGKYNPDLCATFISSGVKYKAYLITSEVNGVDCYQLLDIEKG